MGNYAMPPTTYTNFWNPLKSFVGTNSSLSERWQKYRGDQPLWMIEGYENDPRLAYNVYSTLGGFGNSSSFKNWLDSNYQDYYSGYLTHAAANPTMWWGDYLKELNPERDFGWVDPYKRGENQRALSSTMKMMR